MNVIKAYFWLDKYCYIVKVNFASLIKTDLGVVIKNPITKYIFCKFDGRTYINHLMYIIRPTSVVYYYCLKE